MKLLNEFADARAVELAEENLKLARARLVRAPRLNLARLISDLSHERMYGEDREAIQEMSRTYGIQHPDPQRPFIPFCALRDLNVANSGQGGYLVSSDTRDAIDLLRPWSVTVRAGLTVETGMAGNEAIPKTTSKATPYWLSTETAQLTASQPQLAQTVLTPHTAGAFVAFSRQLSIQTNADRYVRRELLRTVGTAVDQATINGSGVSGQPSGILLAAGVQTQSGTTLNAGALTMKRKSAEANVADDRIAFLSTPAVRELLEGRERAAGSGRFVWDRDTVADRPAFVSTDVPTATMIEGDFSDVFLGIWGAGFVLEVNPYDPTAFKAGGYQARVLVSCDVAVMHPEGFVVASSIT